MLKEETNMKAQVYITLKNGVLDPQGKAIQGALGHLGFGGIDSVKQGKFIEIELGETDKAKAEKIVKDMCEKLLANTVVENYKVEIV
jgi:phosphoribosylformylglycinamidine synthase PurS subunit